MDKYDREQLLDEASNLICEAVQKIRDAIGDTKFSDECESYIIAHLEGWALGTNPYDYTSIPKLIERLNNEDDEDEDE
jgi:hypothetical protein